jgi:hypothetical protein
MLKKLKEIIFRKPLIEMNHEFFGKMLFMGEDIPAEDDYWECEIGIKGYKKPIAVSIIADIEGPTPGQVEFYKQVSSNLDDLFKRCWPIFESDFEQWTGKKFSGQWKDDFELEGIGIPKDADTHNDWHVCYFVDSAGHYFTAQFENGEPKYNEIDG